MARLVLVGIFNSGTLTLVNSVVSGNSGSVLGGGVLIFGGGTLIMSNSLVSDNSASRSSSNE